MPGALAGIVTAAVNQFHALALRTQRSRANAMRTDTGNADAAGDSTAAASSITYCQAVLWINPLLAAIEKANNQLAEIRQIKQERHPPTASP